MPERLGTLRAWAKALRWAGVEGFIRTLAWEHGLDVDRMEVDKGWIRVTIRYQVSGFESDLHRFRRAMRAAVKEYNAN